MNDFEIISKVLTANDIGLTGGHQAGITVPQYSGMLEFFPKLDENIVNPSTRILCTDFSSQERTYLRYVYYNGKIHGTSTRNEYRITGLTKYFRDRIAEVGDDLIFRRHPDGQFSIDINKSSPSAENITVIKESTKITLTGKWSSYKIRK